MWGKPGSVFQLQSEGLSFLGIFALQDQTVHREKTEEATGDGPRIRKNHVEQRWAALPVHGQEEEDKPGKGMSVRWEKSQDGGDQGIFGVCPVMVNRSSERIDLFFPEQSELHLSLLQ